MPYLRIFDIRHHVIINATDREVYPDIFDQFESPFWFERQWFFAYHIHGTGVTADVFFYSTNPYSKTRFLHSLWIPFVTAPIFQDTMALLKSEKQIVA
ncbi:unnamed protein product, partial [Rotaria sp. Silwood1]